MGYAAHESREVRDLARGVDPFQVAVQQPVGAGYQQIARHDLRGRHREGQPHAQYQQARQ